MIATQTATGTHPSNSSDSTLKVKVSKKGLSKSCFIITAFLMFTLLTMLAVWFMGDRPQHTSNPHPLLTAFEQSPTHRKLLTQISKGRLSVVYGQNADGLAYFGQHIANKLVAQNQSVQFLNHSAGALGVESVMVKAKGVLNSYLGVGNYSGVNILQWGSGDPIPAQTLQQALNHNPNGRLIILAPSPLNLTQAQQYSFPELESQLLQKVLTKSHKLKPKIANIIVDYYPTREELYEAMSEKKFNASAHLGAHSQKLKGITKGDQKMLDELCKNGISKSQEAGVELEKIGVVRIGTRNYWLNRETLFNYELQTQNNCVNRVATPLVLESIRVIQQKEEELKLVKHQELKKVEDEEVNIEAEKVIKAKQQNQERLRQQQMLKDIEIRQKELQKQQKKLKSASTKKQTVKGQAKVSPQPVQVSTDKKAAKQAKKQLKKPKEAKPLKQELAKSKPVVNEAPKGDINKPKKAEEKPKPAKKVDAKGKSKTKSESTKPTGGSKTAKGK